MIKITKYLRVNVLTIALFVFCIIFNKADMLCVTYAVMILHELAHCLAAVCIGLKISHIDFYPFGVNLKLKNKLVYSLADEMILYFSGPFCNILFALIAMIVYSRYPNESVKFFYISNTMLFCMNMIPSVPLDGGILLKKIIAYRLGYNSANKIMTVISAVFSAMIMGLGIYVMYITKFNFSVLLFSALMIGNIFTQSEKYNVDLISVGNGTASRESEQVIVELLKELDRPVQYVIVNEAGASVYSASKLATEEFPNFDVGQRSAASIARRLQDPLAELVKIDPKSIGVGQYQHDMNQKKLSDALSGVVEDSVNKVGVDLNTASASLLEYVSGINKTIAKNIVDYRENNGRFVSRKQLLKVPKLGPKAYEQCAGFLRIPDGKNPLDATSVHPESYEAAEQLMAKLGLTMEDIKEAQKQAAAKKASGKSGAQASGQKNGSNAANTAKKREEQKGKTVRVHNTNTAMGKALAAAMGGVSFDNSAETSTKKNAPAVQNASNDAKDISGLEKRIKNKKLLAEELGIGEITLTDILKELEKPGRDPRDDMPKPILRSDVLDMKDLKPGMILKGTVRNVIDFGVFVDIGVHQDGLVHISQITDRYIKHPLEAVSVGDIVDVQVLTVDVAKKRIGLTMKIQKQ